MLLAVLVLVVAALSAIAAILWCIHQQMIRDSHAAGARSAELRRQLQEIIDELRDGQGRHVDSLRSLENRVGGLQESLEGPPSMRRPPVGSLAPRTGT